MKILTGLNRACFHISYVFLKKEFELHNNSNFYLCKSEIFKVDNKNKNKFNSIFETLKTAAILLLSYAFTDLLSHDHIPKINSLILKEIHLP